MAAPIARLGRIQPVLLKSLQPAEVHLPPFRATTSSSTSESSTAQRIMERLAQKGQQLPSNLRIMQAPSRKELSGLKAEQRDLVRKLLSE